MINARSVQGHAVLERWPHGPHALGVRTDGPSMRSRLARVLVSSPGLAMGRCGPQRLVFAACLALVALSAFFGPVRGAGDRRFFTLLSNPAARKGIYSRNGTFGPKVRGLVALQRSHNPCLRLRASSGASRSACCGQHRRCVLSAAPGVLPTCRVSPL